MTTITAPTLPGDLNDTIAIQWKNEKATTPGRVVAPGLAITAALHNTTGQLLPGRYHLTVTGCALNLTTPPRCADHIADALDLATNGTVDWTRDAKELRADPQTKTVFAAIHADVDHCGACPGGDVDLHAWAASQARSFRTFENREMAMWPDDQDRDTALVEWVMRVLARPENAHTAEVLEAIEKQRAVTA